MVGRNDVVQWVTPLPPSRSGIGQYSRELLRLVDGRWPIVVYAEDGGSPSRLQHITVRPGTARSSYDPDLPTIFQLGNSGAHRFAFERALTDSGILVLHDVVLHNGRLGELLRTGGGRNYKRTMVRRYAAGGARIAGLVLSGHAPENLADYPLSEDYIERARLTIVHSEYARSLVQAHVPGARVVHVPHGIALPALVPQDVARRALGLPEHAFIIASITHVNPFKRIPVVLRALRRIVASMPEALFVIAGSVGEGIDLEGEIRFQRLERHVRLLGYVNDDEARLLARAADVSVNLRYPHMGETSGSLLRILGAGRPVIVTDHPAMAEYPRDAVLPVPIDRFEDEMVADLLLMLAERDAVREAAGLAARRFIENEHTLAIALEGYRQATASAYGSWLPSVDGVDLHEPTPRVSSNEPSRSVPYSSLDATLADALSALRLDLHEPTIRAAARALVELGLDRLPSTGTDDVNRTDRATR